MTIRRLLSWGTAALILATIGCGSNGGGGTGGTGVGAGGGSATGGSKGTGGAGGAATAGGTGSGGTSATGGTQGTGGAAGQAGVSGNAGTGGIAGASGGAGAGGHAAATTALVDNDASDNNTPGVASPVPSLSDKLFPNLLAAEQIPYDLLVEPVDGSTEAVTATNLASYSTVIWYTGDNFGTPPTISASQQTTLQDWLDLGGKTLIVYSEEILQDFNVDWTTVHGNAFLTDYVGLTGAVADVDEVNQGKLEDVDYTVTGTSSPAFSGLTFDITTPITTFSTTADAFNPMSGTDVLLTTPADPTNSGTDSTTAVAVGHTKGTSKIVVVGVPIETVHGAPTGTQAQMFHAVLQYVGLKAN